LCGVRCSGTFCGMSKKRKPLFARNPRRWRKNLFDDLPFEKQQEAQRRLGRYCENHRGDSRRGLLAILIGQARRWALTSQEERSRLGHSLLASRAARALQQKLREQGLSGPDHPFAHRAARISMLRRKSKRKNCEEELERQKLKLPPKTRSKWLPIG
jgi:hypothetical protein